MAVNPERGGAIILLFIAVTLFGAVSYAFLQGSRTSTTMMTDEAAKAAGYRSQDCTNAINMATKRLQTRGCQMAQISNDATGAVGTGPADGSCAVYHPNGGGVKGNCVPPPAPPADCITVSIGEVCGSDNAIYIGMIGGKRIYAASADTLGTPNWMWKTAATATAGTTSTTDGLANTNAMIVAGAAAHRAGNACKTKAPAGTWYLPAKDEFNLIFINRGLIDLALRGFRADGTYYWVSTQYDATRAWVHSLNGSGIASYISKTSAVHPIRCVRR